MYVPQETPIISIYLLHINVYLFIIMETCTDRQCAPDHSYIYLLANYWGLTIITP